MLKLHIIGQDTLAAAARECCAKHHDVQDKPDAETAILWCCHDTPIMANDRPDAHWVMNRIHEALPSISKETLILISSQLPVGTTARLKSAFPEYEFAHSPENIRVKTAMADFAKQARVIVGVDFKSPRKHWHRALLTDLFAPFTEQLIVCDWETAECAKHILNTFLGLQISFANEAARFAKSVGADPAVITRALRTDFRVSPNAPLLPGAPFGGGHLARDIFVVNEIAAERGLDLPLISRIMESNRHGSE